MGLLKILWASILIILYGILGSMLQALQFITFYPTVYLYKGQLFAYNRYERGYPIIRLWALVIGLICLFLGQIFYVFNKIFTGLFRKLDLYFKAFLPKPSRSN